MKPFQLVILAGVTAAAVGCSGDDGPTTVEVTPQAGVRFFNASPDAPATMEAVFVDRVENAYTFRRVPYRGHSGTYQGVNEGARQLRVFRPLSTAGVDTAQVVVLDTSFTLTANRRYTIVQVGSALAARGTANSARVVVFEDTLPESVPAGSIAVRTYNMVPTAATASVTIAPRTSAGVGAAAAPAFTVPFLGRSAFVTVPALAAADTSAFYNFAVTAGGAAVSSNFPTSMSAVPGGPTLSAAGIAAVSGTATTAPTLATAGVRQGGSVLSAFIVPGVTGAAAGSANAATTTVLVPDRAPPAPAP